MIWIDVVNQPHVRFWRRFLRKFNVEALVTTREKGDLPQLTNLFLGEWNPLVVGRWGKDRLDKLKAFSERVKKLMFLLDEYKVELALSKGSTEQARVSFGLGIPLIVVNDNDLPPHVVTRLTFPLSKVAIVPECFSGPIYGETRRFKGICEVAHVLDYLESPTNIEHKRLELEENEYLVIRPPPKSSHYLEEDGMFRRLIDKLLRETELEGVILRREGGIELPRGEVYQGVVDGLDLISTAAGVISGGGTMIREAALLGIPSISLFPREEPCVTSELIAEGLIVKPKPENLVMAFKELQKRAESSVLKEKAESYIERVGDPVDLIYKTVNELLSNY